MAYWLFKTEPDECSIDDIAAAKGGVQRWDGIRNYQARNLLRDEVKIGEQVLIYHSSCKQVGVVGIAEVLRAAYPDPAQFNDSSPYFDSKASAAAPRWFCVDIGFREKFTAVLSLADMRTLPGLENMVLLKQGRLSVQPVSAREWSVIERARLAR